MVAGTAVVGDRVKIQNNVSVYDAVTLEDEVFCGPACVFTNVVNPRAAIERKAEYLPTLVRRGAAIGANATIVCGAVLGALLAGAPARRLGWMSRAGARLGPDLVCPIDGSRSREEEGGARLVAL